MFDKVKDILVTDLQINPADITMDAELVNDLGINSLELADLVMLCEEKLGIVIDDSEIRTFITVGDIVSFLSEKLGE
ncbi:MAG: acyl carrier protein [Clostridia bacterium]|nr:acyl carrier protein [Clostridia bacterium]MBQ4575538.1 acyl carrier protein [Clostridia bacterium]